jgi:hypothetical protein
MIKTFNLVVHPEAYMMVRLPARTERPSWLEGRFTSITESREGVTVIGRQMILPADIDVLRDLRCIEIADESDLNSVAILTSVTVPLAQAEISLFAHSTWSTDFVFVQDEHLQRALTALRSHGHNILL